MLYRIKFISDEVDGFVREVKIDSDATFLDLNHIILQSCGYPDDQMTSFYICNDEWERGQQITREDMGVGNADEDIYAMDEVRLSEFIEDEEQRLEFVFDPFADRCFFLDVKEIIPGENLKSPVILRAKGEAPRQINELDTDFTTSVPTAKGKKVAAAAEEDFDDEAVFGDTAFNDDDIDLEGFEISDGQPF
ncbi:MAG: hypothetical protein PUE17_08395 [Bacteroidales bacterium]|nr:plasmid pRiA4b ORF-3 family protein [Bacteroidales bacterium]MDD6732643.1 hypothetical protein [Bacteroidales bacterium]